MPTKNSKAVRLALVGVGPWGTLLGNKFIQAGASIVHYVRGNGPDIDGFGTRLSLGELSTASDLDGVILATPPKVTLSLATQLASAGLGIVACKPLWIETPVKLCAPFFVDYVRLWSPAYVLLKQAIGHRHIQRIDAIFVGKGPYRDFSSLDDYGSHLLAFLHDLMGYDALLSQVDATATPRDEFGGVLHRSSGLVQSQVPFTILAGNGAKDKNLVLKIDVRELGCLEYQEHEGKVSLKLNQQSLFSGRHDPLMALTTEFIDQFRQRRNCPKFLNLSCAIQKSLKKLQNAEVLRSREN